MCITIWPGPDRQSEHSSSLWQELYRKQEKGKTSLRSYLHIPHINLLLLLYSVYTVYAEVIPAYTAYKHTPPSYITYCICGGGQNWRLNWHWWAHCFVYNAFLFHATVHTWQKVHFTGKPNLFTWTLKGAVSRDIRYFLLGQKLYLSSLVRAQNNFANTFFHVASTFSYRIELAKRKYYYVIIPHIILMSITRIINWVKRILSN